MPRSVACSGLPADQIEHFGDNDDSDVGRARAAGLRATPFKQAVANRYEKIAPEVRKLEPSLWLGLCRQTRLAAPAAVSEAERVIWEVSANVSAPLIALFVDWCLRESRAAGIERLYFLSRDGEVMMQVAGILGRRDPKAHRLPLPLCVATVLAPAGDRRGSRAGDELDSRSQQPADAADRAAARGDRCRRSGDRGIAGRRGVSAIEP